MQFIKRFLSETRAAAAIEMAFAFPIILWLVAAIIELGIVFHVSSLANYAATEAARKGKTGSVYGSNKSREQLTYDLVHETMKPWIFDEGDFTFSSKSYGSFQDIGVNGVVGAGGRGHLVVYDASLEWHWFTPIMSQLMGNDTLPIRARVLVRNEN